MQWLLAYVEYNYDYVYAVGHKNEALHSHFTTATVRRCHLIFKILSLLNFQTEQVWGHSQRMFTKGKGEVSHMRTKVDKGGR